MTLRRGFQVFPGGRFAVIEDVVTTGGSTREVVDLLRAAAAEPLVAGSIVDRSGGQRPRRRSARFPGDHEGRIVAAGRLPTIQGVLEQIVSGIEGRPVQVAGSGRTDAGVHALAKVAAISIENPLPMPNLRKAVNGEDEPSPLPWGGRTIIHMGNRQPSRTAPSENNANSPREGGYQRSARGGRPGGGRFT
jgi:hypothetical protein